MSEVVLAHFRHHWEADLAQGYLEDAGVPSRLVSDGAAGGQPYVGGLAGASVRVSPGDAHRARRVLERAGILDPDTGEPGGAHLAAARPLSPVQASEKRDLEERLQAARKAEVRHFIRCMLGVTPAAIIPIVGLALEGNVALLALLCALVVVAEGWRWIRAGRLARRTELALAALAEDAEENGQEDGEESGV